MEKNWHTLSLEKTFNLFQSSERGLSSSEARQRLKKYGLNRLPDAQTDGWLVIFVRQFQSSLIYILLFASLIVFLMGEIVDGSIILFVLIFNALTGTIQEGKAQNTLRALRKFTATTATVLRDEQEIIMTGSELVPGDILILQEGEKVAADARIISADNLKVDESMMTGESAPVHKIAGDLKNPKLTSAEQTNMIFKGSNAVAGHGRAIVVATGLETVIGQISKEIISLDTNDIPLKTEIKNLSRLIVMVVAIISLTLLGLGWALGEPLGLMFTTVISLAVSVIPEGLPIVMTLVLATGVWRMSKRQALVKKLQAVEALGQAQIIAVDKTGTLTKNEMAVQKIYLDGQIFDIESNGYDPKGEIRLGGEIIDTLNHPELLLIGKISAFCSNARLIFNSQSQEWKIAGDPTEAATLVLAEKIGFHQNDLEHESPRLVDFPFDYQVKYHATIHSEVNKNLLTVMGAPEAVLDLSNKLWRDGQSIKFNQKNRQEIETTLSAMLNKGLRVVALAMKQGVGRGLVPDEIQNLTFVGFLGITDTIRPEAGEAIQEATSAGIKVVMITGDHQITAKAIAQEVGIYHQGDQVLSGREIESWTEEQLAEKLERVSVFARVTPEHKLKIINAYKKRGEIVAMTGDGVNDASSLVAADLGVAMGKIGTEVAKEAADIVLLDDNFGSIVSAIEEGRSIYQTIKKVILYLFSTRLGEVLVIMGAMFLGYPLPILPAQIIWLNFVTDGFLDVSLGMEPKENGLLKNKFKRPGKYLVDGQMFGRMILMALPMMLGTLFIFSLYFKTNLTKAWTMSLTTMAIFQWFNAWNCRSQTESIFKLNPLTNKFLAGATLIVISLQLLAVYHPLFQTFLRTSSLSISDWTSAVLVALSIIAIEETRKMLWSQASTIRRNLSTVLYSKGV